MGDLKNKLSSNVSFILICFNQSIVYWANPKVFSPFMSYIIGKSVSKNGRTAINSLTFILSTSCSAVFTEVAT